MLLPGEITGEVEKKTLNYLLFLKQKRCGKIKARGCADGRPQKQYVARKDSSSPTILTNALMAVCIMNVMVQRKVISVDIPVAFLQSPWPEGDDCYLKFTGMMFSMI